ncbi:uncharacterized protein P884DRAFT_198285, partial [Thermothelomyces heterothallicus CBS 202.75]|uniref:uncharacterized protein n=1 Tax=Thermothelomyces heterothallicus CBS 202.75 TaxID=1149848 RepID=UPI0037445503
CKDCIDGTQRVCKICGGGYCLIHNEGSNMLTVCPESPPHYLESSRANQEGLVDL